MLLNEWSLITITTNLSPPAEQKSVEDRRTELCQCPVAVVSKKDNPYCFILDMLVSLKRPGEQHTVAESALYDLHLPIKVDRMSRDSMTRTGVLGSSTDTADNHPHLPPPVSGVVTCTIHGS